MKRRPTIPFFEWRIAVHLERTKEIQKISGMPAYECKCELCESWKRSFEKVIPEQTLIELQRLGVQLNAPNELYAHPQDSSSRYVRAVFHIVGKIVSGPDNVSNSIEEIQRTAGLAQLILKQRIAKVLRR